MKIRWSPMAVSDLESIREYIARDSPSEQNQGYCVLISLVEGRRSLLVAST
jgi:hypothetical protein